MSERDINNIEIKNKVKGAEIIFFEDNPNAVSFEGEEDQSQKFLNEIVIANALSQTSNAPSLDIGNLIDKLSFLKSPVNWIYIIFACVLIYGVIFGGLGWIH